MGKKRSKKKKHKPKTEHQPPKQEHIWIEGQKLNEKTGKLEAVRYKLKPRHGCSW